MKKKEAIIKDVKENGKFFLEFLLKQSGIGLILTVLAILVCYLLGYRAPRYYSNAVVIVGLGALVIGAYGILGNMKTSTDYSSILAASTSQAGFKGKIDQNRKMLNNAYSSCVRAFFISIIPIVSSILFSLM